MKTAKAFVRTYDLVCPHCQAAMLSPTGESWYIFDAVSPTATCDQCFEVVLLPAQVKSQAITKVDE